MSFTTIRLELNGAVAKLTLNRPERLNAINDFMHDELWDALESLPSTARALVLTGAGRGFCAGQDLNDRGDAASGSPRDLGESVERRYNPLVRRLIALDIPWISAVNGVAAGAGANLAFAADLCIAQETAYFMQSFTRIGLMPDCGGTWHLPNRIGQARALGLALTGDSIDARTAADWGLIWRAVPDDSFDEEVDCLAQRLASGATRALVATRHAIYRAAHTTLDNQLDYECAGQRELGYTRDYAEGVTAFSEKRPPRFRGC